MSVIDDDILRYLAEYDGGRTHKIAGHIGAVTTAEVRRRLLSLERAGLVRRSERYSACNCIFWEAQPHD